VGDWIVFDPADGHGWWEGGGGAEEMSGDLRDSKKVTGAGPSESLLTTLPSALVSGKSDYRRRFAGLLAPF
jgi:hypothetical protein